MTSRKSRTVKTAAGLAGLLWLATLAEAQAQIPAIPSAAGAGLGGAGTGVGTSALGAAPATAGAAGTPQTLWGFFGLSKQNLAACKLKICRSPIGQALNGFATGPLGAVTGGLLANCCPPPTAAEIAALEAQGGPQGAAAVAAKIQADEADAKARVAAVDYLGTVDCRYWKEAQIALLNALRADRNECVRFAAARAFNNGCCCSKEVIETLRIVVAGEDTDGFPAEPSARVKGTCFAALQNCLMKVGPVINSGKPLEPERGPAPVPAPPAPADTPGLTPETAVAPLPEAPGISTIEGVPFSSLDDPNGEADPSHLPAAHLEPISAPSPFNNLAMSEKTPPGLTVFESRVRFKSMATTVAEAERTLQEVANRGVGNNAAMPLPAGKQSVFHALLKARQDVAANDAARIAAEPARIEPSGPVPPLPSLPALQPTPSPSPSQRSQEETAKVRFDAPPPPSLPSRKVEQPKPAPAPKVSFSMPKLPSLSLPMASKATDSSTKPALTVAAAPKPSKNVKPLQPASQKTDSGVMEASIRVKPTASAPKAAYNAIVAPPASPVARGSQVTPIGATSTVPFPPAYTPLPTMVKPSTSTKPKVSAQPIATPSPLPLPTVSKPKATLWPSNASTAKAKPAANAAKPTPIPPPLGAPTASSTTGGRSVLQAFTRARRNVLDKAAAAVKGDTTAKAGQAAASTDQSTANAPKIDEAAKPVSYWGPAKPKTVSDSDSDSSNNTISTRVLSKLFPDRSGK